MKINIYYYSHKILQSNFRCIIIIMLFSAIYFSININLAENMGNCLNTSTALPASEMLNPRYQLSQLGIEAENRALNTIINDLRQEIVDFKHQIAVNNQLNEEQNNLIQKLTIEQKETKELIVGLKFQISKANGTQNIMQEENYRCMK